MSDWIYTNISDTNSIYTLDEMNAKFGGIQCEMVGSSGTTYKFTFSDGTIGQFELGSGNNVKFLVNDDKHVIVRLSTEAIPYSGKGTYAYAIFVAGLFPLMDGSLLSLGPVDTGDYIGHKFNIPYPLVEMDSTATDLILSPCIGTPRGANSDTNFKIFKDLFVCCQRQFKAGDIVISSSGDRYISMGGWFLFKM